MSPVFVCQGRRGSRFPARRRTPGFATYRSARFHLPGCPQELCAGTKGAQDFHREELLLSTTKEHRRDSSKFRHAPHTCQQSFLPRNEIRVPRRTSCPSASECCPRTSLH